MRCCDEIEFSRLISFDPNLRLSLWKTPEEARKRILYGMKQCDIMKISEEEVAFVSEQESLEKGVSFIRDNSDIKILFVTLGNKGSIAYYKDEKIYCGGIHQEHVVDTTGAGDTFCGAVLSRILELGTDALTEKDIREKCCRIHRCYQKRCVMFYAGAGRDPGCFFLN